MLYSRYHAVHATNLTQLQCKQAEGTVFVRPWVSLASIKASMTIHAAKLDDIFMIFPIISSSELSQLLDKRVRVDGQEIRRNSDDYDIQIATEALLLGSKLVSSTAVCMTKVPLEAYVSYQRQDWKCFDPDIGCAPDPDQAVLKCSLQLLTALFAGEATGKRCKLLKASCEALLRYNKRHIYMESY